MTLQSQKDARAVTMAALVHGIFCNCCRTLHGNGTLCITWVWPGCAGLGVTHMMAGDSSTGIALGSNLPSSSRYLGITVRE